ncbi:MAG: hypothetical protein WBD68_12205, partial [Candidatus Sulfotelmatobacter sp.]
VDGGAQAEHCFGGVQVIETRKEEASCGVEICDAAADEEPGERVKWTGLLVMTPHLIWNREVW